MSTGDNWTLFNRGSASLIGWGDGTGVRPTVLHFGICVFFISLVLRCKMLMHTNMMGFIIWAISIVNTIRLVHNEQTTQVTHSDLKKNKGL